VPRVWWSRFTGFRVMISLGRGSHATQLSAGSSAVRSSTCCRLAGPLHRSPPIFKSVSSRYLWRKREQIDAGLLAGLTSLEQAELVAARRGIRELEAELAIHQRAAELLKTVVPPREGSWSSR
jgi:hypothetical protein